MKGGNNKKGANFYCVNRLFVGLIEKKLTSRAPVLFSVFFSCSFNSARPYRTAYWRFRVYGIYNGLLHDYKLSTVKKRRDKVLYESSRYGNINEVRDALWHFRFCTLPTLNYTLAWYPQRKKNEIPLFAVTFLKYLPVLRSFYWFIIHVCFLFAEETALYTFKNFIGHKTFIYGIKTAYWHIFLKNPTS